MSKLGRSAAPPRVGSGSSIAHHGEILQGLFEGEDGGLHRGLVTLPCQPLRSMALFRPRAGGLLSVDPRWKVKAREAARLTLAHLDLDGAGGELSIAARIPVGWGLGSSTSDVIAAIRAVATAFRVHLPPAVVAGLAVRAETASDAVMFDGRAVLFGQREGVVLEDFGHRLPALEVLGVNADPAENGVDTLVWGPAEYSPSEIESFRSLRALLRQALATQDGRLVGLVATASARINQRHLPKPHFDLLERLVETVGALGLQIAHSGTVVGILFDPAAGDKEDCMAMARAKLAEPGFRSTWHFTTGAAGAARPNGSEAPLAASGERMG